MNFTLLGAFIAILYQLIDETVTDRKWWRLTFYGITTLLLVYPTYLSVWDFFISPRSKVKRLLFGFKEIVKGTSLAISEEYENKLLGKSIYCNQATLFPRVCNHQTWLVPTVNRWGKAKLPRSFFGCQMEKLFPEPSQEGMLTGGFPFMKYLFRVGELNVDLKVVVKSYNGHNEKSISIGYDSSGVVTMKIDDLNDEQTKMLLCLLNYWSQFPCCGIVHAPNNNHNCSILEIINKIRDGYSFQFSNREIDGIVFIENNSNTEIIAIELNPMQTPHFDLAKVENLKRIFKNSNLIVLTKYISEFTGDKFNEVLDCFDYITVSTFRRRLNRILGNWQTKRLLADINFINLVATGRSISAFGGVNPTLKVQEFLKNNKLIETPKPPMMIKTEPEYSIVKTKIKNKETVKNIGEENILSITKKGVVVHKKEINPQQKLKLAALEKEKKVVRDLLSSSKSDTLDSERLKQRYRKYRDYEKMFVFSKEPKVEQEVKNKSLYTKKDTIDDFINFRKSYCEMLKLTEENTIAKKVNSRNQKLKASLEKNPHVAYASMVENINKNEIKQQESCSKKRNRTANEDGWETVGTSNSNPKQKRNQVVLPTVETKLYNTYQMLSNLEPMEIKPVQVKQLNELYSQALVYYPKRTAKEVTKRCINQKKKKWVSDQVEIGLNLHGVNIGNCFKETDEMVEKLKIAFAGIPTILNKIPKTKLVRRPNSFLVKPPLSKRKQLAAIKLAKMMRKRSVGTLYGGEEEFTPRKMAKSMNKRVIINHKKIRRKLQLLLQKEKGVIRSIEMTHVYWEGVISFRTRHL